MSDAGDPPIPHRSEQSTEFPEQTASSVTATARPSSYTSPGCLASIL